MSGHRSTTRGSRRLPALGAALALLAIVVAACSSAASTQVGPFPSAAASPAAAFGPALAPSGAEAGPSGSTNSGDKAAAQAAVDGNLIDGQLIVYTGQAAVQVADLDKALASAATAVRGLGGYVAASQRDGTDESATATITYRVPANRWDDAVAAVEQAAAKVLSIKTSSDEVTSQVVDLGARIDNLQATEQALQGIMAKATKIPDILSIQEQLTSVQGQIEQLTAQKQTLEKQAAMGTLSVTYSLPPVEVTRVTSGWDPGSEVDRAAATLVSIGQGLANAGIWLGIVGLPILVIGLVVLGIAFLLVRRARRRGPAGSPPSAGPIIPTAQA